MEIEIESKKENKLLDRMEINFAIKHEGGTPKREDVRKEISSMMGVNRDVVIIDWMKSAYGISETTGYAKVYSSPKKAMEIEPDYLLKRNPVKKEEKREEKKKRTTKIKRDDK
jgi:small subunit ribosomal protein S24e